MRKLLDKRISDLINKVKEKRHRGFFVIIGNNAKDQVPTLHQLLFKSSNALCHDILWCYKDNLELSSDPKKRRRQMRKKVRLGQMLEGEENALELFLSSNKVSHVHYQDAHKVLGRTFSLCVLQNFEALTPNILAQTVETVSGAGLVVILLRKMSSLRKLSSLAMDFYGRFRPGGRDQGGIAHRFIERFTLSLSWCQDCLVVDDELNVLPISSTDFKLSPKSEIDLIKDFKENESELECLKEEMRETTPLSHLLELCKTLDQAKALLSFVDVSIDLEKKSDCVVSVTASRGRGKTFVCGLFIAYGIMASKISNVYVVSPYPQNLGPLFESLETGLKSAGQREHVDFEKTPSPENNHQKAIVRFTATRDGFRRVVQYVSPEEHSITTKSGCDLIVIDEAAAIPLPITKEFLKAPCISILSSTTSGYEGTGRSLTHKLLHSLREMSFRVTKKNNTIGNNGSAKPKNLREVSLVQPIRYAPGDQVEQWLCTLLCLETPLRDSFNIVAGSAPHPSSCSLCAVDRDSLFSGHSASESFLARVMSLFVSAHYRNSPDDLQLLSDAPEHRLFALVHGLEPSSKKVIPEVLCVIQVAFEGCITKEVVQKGFRERVQNPGDLIPWTLSTQFQEKTFAQRYGARIVRVATHPDLQGMGYGSYSVTQLIKAFSKNVLNNNENNVGKQNNTQKNGDFKNIKTENGGIDPENPQSEAKTVLGPLLTPIEKLDFNGAVSWIGSSFGLTQKLHSFWANLGLSVVYLRQKRNPLTGEHSCIMLKDFVKNTENSGHSENVNERFSRVSAKFFVGEFFRRFLSLLASDFRGMNSNLALCVAKSLRPKQFEFQKGVDNENKPDRKQTILVLLPESSMRRLTAYSKSFIDFSSIVDIIPNIAELFFRGCFKNMNLSHIQMALLVAVGLQRKKIESFSNEINIPVSQLLGLLNKAIRKVVKNLKEDFGDKN